MSPNNLIYFNYYLCTKKIVEHILVKGYDDSFNYLLCIRLFSKHYTHKCIFDTHRQTENLYGIIICGCHLFVLMFDICAGGSINN